MIYSRMIILMFGVLLASSVTALSGSIGGTLGKTKKSISGVVKKRAPVAKRQKAVSRTKAIPNYQGTWHWKVQCPLTRIWTGTFTLNGPASSLHGNFTMDQPGGNGTFLGGSFNGSRIVIRRMTGLLVQTWDGVISATGNKAIIAGTASHALESCSFTARK